MKIIQLIIAITFLSTAAIAQMNFNDPYRQEISTDYTIELAIKYGDHILSEMPWSSKSQMLGMQMYEKLSLTILDNSKRLSAIESPTFQIAIKDIKSGTQRMYSNEVYTEIPVEEIIQQCKEGESLIILTTDRKYVLRDNVIELLLGC